MSTTRQARTASTAGQTPVGETPARPFWQLFVVFALIGLNLRPAIASISPVLDDIKADLGISSAVAGILTTIPVACMGFLAPVAHRAGARFGMHRTVLFSLLVLTIGQALRLASRTTVVLYGSTLITGAAIAGISTMMAGIVRRHSPTRLGLGTAVYSSALTVGASVAALSAVPLSHGAGGWPEMLASWSLLALLGAAVWFVMLPPKRYDLQHLRHEVDPAHAPPVAGALPWRSRTAWLVATYLMFNAMIFYSTLTWLPPSYRDLGWSAGVAGGLLSLFNLVQAIGMLTLPLLADRRTDARPLLAIAAVLATAGMLGLAVAPKALAWPSAIIGGFGVGGGFALGLTAIARYSKVPGDAPRLSAMAFLVSYGLAACTPPALGALRDSTGSDRAGFAILAVLGAGQLLTSTRLRPGRAI